MKKQIGLMTLSLMLASPALAGGGGAPAKAPAASCRTIAQLVAANPDLSTLNTAIDAAGLTSTLAGAGSYTVFAPNNAAFAKVPSDQLAGILNDPAALRGLVLYHVVAEKATAAQIRGVKGGTTVQGADIAVSTQGNVVMINNARVVKADINACNGIIHIVDTVLMPPVAEAAPAPAPEPAAAAPAPEPAPAAPAPEPAAAPAPVAAPMVIPATPLSGSTITGTTTTSAATTDTTQQTTTTTTTDTTAATTTTTTATTDTTAVSTSVGTLYDVIQQDDRFSTLRTLISDAGLEDDLSGDSGEYTIFAPTNEAFDTLPEDIIPAISADKDALKKVLQYHLINKKVSSADLAGTLQTMEGTELDLGAATVGTVVNAGNGVLYPIDVVLLPPDFVVPSVQAVAAAPAPAPAPAAPASISAYVTGEASLSTFRELLTIAGLADTLGGGSYTVFAPSNDAFAKVDAAALDNLKKDAAKLKTFLQGFIVEGAPTALAAGSMKSLAQTDLNITVEGTGFKVGEAKTVGNVVNTGTGNVYIIDNVALPLN